MVVPGMARLLQEIQGIIFERGLAVKILIIEDDMVVTDILKEYLEDAGYGYECAVNGREGMSKLQASGGKFDIILLDRMMPEMDGMEFMRHMEKEPGYAKIPVIMQTAAGSVPEVIDGSRTGIYYYMTKPYSEELLLSVIRSADAHRKSMLASAN
jgi:DNA-binding response OmpR family regulator